MGRHFGLMLIFKKGNQLGRDRIQTIQFTDIMIDKMFVSKGGNCRILEMPLINHAEKEQNL